MNEGELVLLAISERWVIVGEVAHVVPGQRTSVVLKGAHVVRVWGTKSGIGQLKDAPTASTVLDRIGDVTVDLTKVLFHFTLEKKGWAAKLK